MASLTVVQAPGVRPVEVEDLTEYLKLPDIPEDDARLSRFIDAAIANVEGFLNRACINRTVRELVRPVGYFTDWKTALAPIVSISEIKIDDTVLTSSDYDEPVDTDGGVIEFTERQRVARIQLTYVAGYGTTPAEVPSAIRQAILADAAFLYTNPTSTSLSGDARLACQTFRRFFL